MLFHVGKLDAARMVDKKQPELICHVIALAVFGSDKKFVTIGGLSKNDGESRTPSANTCLGFAFSR